MRASCVTAAAKTSVIERAGSTSWLPPSSPGTRFISNALSRVLACRGERLGQSYWPICRLWVGSNEDLRNDFEESALFDRTEIS